MYITFKANQHCCAGQNVWYRHTYSILSSPSGASCGKSGGKSTSKLDAGTTRMAEALPGHSTKRAGSALRGHRDAWPTAFAISYIGLTLPAGPFLFASESVILSGSWQTLMCPSCGFASFSCYATVFWWVKVP